MSSFASINRLTGIFSLILLLSICMSVRSLHAQGCVAIRGTSACGGNLGGNINLMKGEFLTQAGFRYFKSYRHFRGSHEETHRIEEGTEVINNSYLFDFALNYGISERWYANVVLPVVFYDRSSMYEHGGNPPNGLGERHETSSTGISDIRLGLGYWLFDPSKTHNYNYALGLGIKLPTGSYDYTDVFYNQGTFRDIDREAVVDQSIQPGDGGFGFTIDLQGFHALSEKFSLSSNLYYLFNVTETNGVLTRNGRSEFSCPDQFSLRVGTYYNTNLQGISAYLGGRFEGVPSSDLIGGSEGYRRPGYVVSIEPGLSYNTMNHSFNIGIPIALVRNRTQSFEDKQRTEESGIYRHGDAAFADYLINFSAQYRFGGNHQMIEPVIPAFDEVNGH